LSHTKREIHGIVQLIIDDLNNLINLTENKAISAIKEYDFAAFRILQFAEEPSSWMHYQDRIVFQNKKTIFLDNIISNLSLHWAEEEEAKLVSRIAPKNLNPTKYDPSSQEFNASNKLRRSCHLLLLLSKDCLRNIDNQKGLNLPLNSAEYDSLNKKSEEKLINLFKM